MKNSSTECELNGSGLICLIRHDYESVQIGETKDQARHSLMKWVVNFPITVIK